VTAGTVNVPELAEEPEPDPEPEPPVEPVLLDFAAGLLELLDLAAALVEPVAGLLELAEPLAELAGAAGEPEPPRTADGPVVLVWLPELAWVVDPPDPHPCRANTPMTAIEPAIVEVRRNIIWCIPPSTQ
jgi:hypothetical protein